MTVAPHRPTPQALTRSKWSIAAAAEMLLRAASYALRPPEPSPTADLIEGRFGYPRLAVLLTVGAVLILAGVATKPALAAAGHVIGLFLCGTFVASIALAALLHDAPWSGAGPLTLVLLAHYAAVADIGSQVIRSHQSRPEV